MVFIGIVCALVPLSSTQGTDNTVQLLTVRGGWISLGTAKDFPVLVSMSHLTEKNHQGKPYPSFPHSLSAERGVVP